jgi:acyl-homoserine-lactone acylase
MNVTRENARGVHAIRVLSAEQQFTPASLLKAAFDAYLPAVADLIPVLVADYDRTPAGNPIKAKLKEQVELLRGWDFRWGEQSTATSLAVFFAEALEAKVAVAATKAGMPAQQYAVERATPAERLIALAAASGKLAADFGRWQTPWGEINRFQRLTGDIVQPFSDTGKSIPVPFTSATWGSLASFGAKAYPGTRKWYGTSGNSFVALVEFGKDSVRARAVTAGGQSGHPDSPHFNDQAQRYASGDLRPVYFYPGQLAGHIERRYHPGER